MSLHGSNGAGVANRTTRGQPRLQQCGGAFSAVFANGDHGPASDAVWGEIRQGIGSDICIDGGSPGYFAAKRYIGDAESIAAAVASLAQFSKEKPAVVAWSSIDSQLLHV